MAIKQAGVWGIDLGQCALKAIRLEHVNGTVTATAFDYIEHPKILSQPDADPDQLVREALEKFLSRNELRGDLVVIAVPGQSGLARFVKLPPVEEKKIPDIVKFEAKQQIPFPLEEVVWDFQKIGSGGVTDGFALDTEIGLFAMKRDMINRYLQHFKDVNVEVHIVQMAPLALCNFVSYDLLARGQGEEGNEEAEDDDESAGKKRCVVALDIGADSSNLVITDGDRIIWQRPIPLGGNHFTRALTKDLKLTFAKAEHVKRNAIKSPDLRKILTALKPVLNDFVSEVQRSLGYFTNTHRDAFIKYMVGLGNAFRLPGLQKYLQEKLQLEVRKLTHLERLTGDEVTAAPQFNENVLSFAAAYGLALQGLKLPRIQTNLLPHEIRMERLVKAKKPWAVAGAAALLLALGIFGLAEAVRSSTITDPNLKTVLDKGKEVVTRAETLVKDYAGVEADIANSKAAVNRIASGAEERFNWNLLYKYVNDALPQPDGSKLSVDTRERARPRDKYFASNKEARDAYKIVVDRQAAPPPTTPPKADEEQKLDTFLKKHLVQINVEGVASLYSDDLGPFFKNLTNEQNQLLSGLSPEEKTTVKSDQEKLPKSGWVFEVRGSTYHEDGPDFIVNTLVENLVRPEAPGVDIKLSPDTQKRIREKIGYVFLYKYDKVTTPEPGPLVQTSSLRALLGSSQQGVAATGPGPGGPRPPGGQQPQGEEAAKTADRSGWVPLGEIASSVLGGSGGGHGGAPGGGAPPRPEARPGNTGTARDQQPRTEFAVLFIWQEPFTPDPGVGFPGQ